MSKLSELQQKQLDINQEMAQALYLLNKNRTKSQKSQRKDRTSQTLELRYQTHQKEILLQHKKMSDTALQSRIYLVETEFLQTLYNKIYFLEQYLLLNSAIYHILVSDTKTISNYFGFKKIRYDLKGSKGSILCYSTFNTYVTKPFVGTTGDIGSSFAGYHLIKYVDYANSYKYENACDITPFLEEQKTKFYKFNTTSTVLYQICKIMESTILLCLFTEIFALKSFANKYNSHNNVHLYLCSLLKDLQNVEINLCNYLSLTKSILATQRMEAISLLPISCKKILQDKSDTTVNKERAALQRVLDKLTKTKPVNWKNFDKAQKTSVLVSGCSYATMVALKTEVLFVPAIRDSNNNNFVELILLYTMHIAIFVALLFRATYNHRESSNRSILYKTYRNDLKKQ